MNRRSEKLDKYLNKRVEITFHDGDVETGILEFGKPYWGFNTDEYSLTRNNDPDVYFRKSHVKSIKEARE